MSLLKGAVATPEDGAPRRVGGLVALLIAAALAATGLAGASAASAAAARGGRGPISVLAPRAGAVIVARTRAGAKRLRLGATLSISRPVGGLSARLNGHPVRLPAIRSGRLGVRLGAANGLAVGENVLQVSAGRRGGRPRWVVPVRFFVGYRDRSILGVRLRQAAGKKLSAAASAVLRVPRVGVRSLVVTLNGTRVQVPAGARLLDLARSGALRRGSNRLRVQLLMTDGRIGELARTFSLGRLRNVAVARLRGRAAVGRTMVLDGGRSLTLPGLRRAAGFRWVLLHRPRLSHARLGRTRGARTTLRPDVPGHYVIALVVGRGSQRGYDALSVSATYPEPLVPVDTIVYHGSTPGIQVGSTFYGLNETGCLGSAAIQVVYLRRDDLAYDGCSGSGLDTDSLNGLAQVLKSSANTDFIIITHPGSKETPPFPADSLPALDNVLRQIGGTLPAKWTFPNATCWSGGTGNCFVPEQGSQLASWQQGDFDGGSFSVIGVPGLTVGQAWRETAAQTHTQDGSVVGYFTQGIPTQTGATGDYTVVNGGPGQYAPVDTCAGGSCAVSVGVNVTATTSAGSAQITSVSPVTGYADGAAVGGPGIPSGATIVSGAGTSTLTISSPATAYATAVGLTVNQSYPAGANGLHVVALDRTTLAPILNQTVTNTTDLHTALTTTGPYATVGHFLPSPGMDDQRLVIIQSVGNGEVTGTATTSLLQDLDELGGTPDLLAGTLAGQKYALVGAATNLPWRNPSALESSTAVPAIPGSSQSQAGEISGAVERDRGGLYAPSSGDPVSPTNTDLPRILYQPAQPWPYVQDTQELNYIADNIGLGAYPDVRSAYLDQNLSESWGLEYSQLSNLNCNDPSQCGSQFDAVKSELLTEFTWVPKVYELGNNLLSPFEQAGAAPYFDVAEVTNQVNASVPVPPASSVSMKWLTIMSDVMEVASGVAAVAGLPASNEFGLIGDAGTLSTDVMEQPNSSGAPADKVTTSAENLAGQMAQQQTAYIQWIGQMETTMLYDYGKLSAVGNAVGNDPAWTWQPTTTSQAITALQANATASAYSALTPVQWSGYNLTPDFVTQTSSNDVTTLSCAPPYQNHSFISALSQNQFHAITSMTGNGGAVDQVWTFAEPLNLGVWSLDNFYGTRSATLPNTSLTDYIYGQYATGHEQQNGTYDYGAYQNAPEWWRDTYNPPGFVQCNAQGNSLYGYSWAATPAQISPPPP